MKKKSYKTTINLYSRNNLILEYIKICKKGAIMKVEVDTLNDSVDEIKKTISLLQEVLEKRTGVTGAGIKAPLRPSEFKNEGPKIIYEDILSTPAKKPKPSSLSTASIAAATKAKPEPKSEPSFNEKGELPVKKRKVLRQDEHVADEEDEDVDRKLPQIQIRDYW
jgi:hypothetical protein